MQRWRALTGWGIVLFTIGLLLLGAWLIGATLSKPKTTVIINSTAIKAVVVKSGADMKKGLGGVENLNKGQGMLFVFQSDAIHPFWMKDMLISIDMIWINSAKKVVYIKSNVSPETYPAQFASTEPARYVLEVPAGTAQEARIRVGQTAQFDAN